jgi:hypothetical protein
LVDVITNPRPVSRAGDFFGYKADKRNGVGDGGLFTLVMKECHYSPCPRQEKNLWFGYRSFADAQDDDLKWVSF